MIIVERRAPTRQAAAKPPAAHQQRHLKGRREDSRSSRPKTKKTKIKTKSTKRQKEKSAHELSSEEKDLDWSAAYVSTTPQTGKPALDLFVIGVLCLESVEHLPAEICDNPVELISSLNINHLLVY